MHKMTISHKTFANVVCNYISELFSSVMQSHGLVEAKSRDFLMHIKTLIMALFHCMVQHGSLLGGFPLGTVPGT